jgi:hypothetical protein
LISKHQHQEINTRRSTRTGVHVWSSPGFVDI